MAYYDTASLYGGMGIGDAFASLSGGWAAPDDLDPYQTATVDNGGEYVTGLYASNPGLETFVNTIEYKFPNSGNTVNTFIPRIYAYDTLLMQGKAADAAALKRLFVGDDAAKRKVWSYLRRKIHLGGSRPLRLTRAQRKERSDRFAAKVASNRTYLGLPTTAWFGSNPYGDDGKLPGRYTGLTVHQLSAEEKAARTPYAARYGSYLTPFGYEPVKMEVKAEPQNKRRRGPGQGQGQVAMNRL